MEQEIKPASGRLGVLVVGVGGAVATTMITGTLASRKGLAKPIGSITQMAAMRMENNEEKDGIIIEELLKKLRESKGWTYNDVAYNLNDTNILTENIKKMESGLEYPDWDVMYKLSELYNVPIEEFVKAKEYSYEKLKNS